MADRNENGCDRIVYVAEPHGMCAGVRRALHMLNDAAGDVYVLHEIVHNNYIVGRLRARGVRFIESPEDAPPGATLVFSAHGVSRAVESRARSRDLRIVDATCPLVKRVHASAAAGVAAGELVLLAGHRGHPEVDSILGQARCGEIRLLEGLEDVASLPDVADRPIRLVAQTTLDPDFVNVLRQAIADRCGVYPEMGAGICYATVNRQKAVQKLAACAELVIVVGSPHSSNSNRLLEVAAAVNENSLLLDHPDALDARRLERVRTVGVSAGASVPDELIVLLLLRLRRAGFVRTEAVRV